MRHFRDPCVHCGTPHDQLEPGPCKGDPSKAVVAQYCVHRQAWQSTNGADVVRVLMSTGQIIEEAHFPSEHWPYSPRFRDAIVRPIGTF